MCVQERGRERNQNEHCAFLTSKRGREGERKSESEVLLLW